MTKVKICGIRRKEDINFVNIYLPDFIGFIFAQSKRRLTCHEAKELSLELDKSIKKVGVFVNEKMDNVINIAEECDLDVVQIHGDETPDYIRSLKENLMKRSPNSGVEIWKAIRVKDRSFLNDMDEFHADAFVLDTFTDGSYGGSGKTFDWSLVGEITKRKRIVLAGGLNIENVKSAIECVNPYAVDISSGVETEGYKDEIKIRDFINAVKSYA
jgi:phosphoribosylanthranilate isomerase